MMSFMGNFHYELVGNPDRPKLVFLHGLMGSAANWRKITQSFRDQFYILTYDQRGHGKSFHPENQGYDPEDFADDLKGILDDLGWEKVYLVGHSMGGRNAMNFAHRFPERLKVLVIEDIGPNADPKAVQVISDLIESVPTPFESKKAAREFLLGAFVEIHQKNPQVKTLSQYFYTNIIERPDGRADWRFSKTGILQASSAGRARDRWEEVESISVPTLLMRGERSVEFPQEIFEEMARRNSLIEPCLIKDSAHWIHFDQPEAFVGELQKFFAKWL